MPAERETPDSGRRERPAAAPGDAPHVVIVEDEPELAELYAAWLDDRYRTSIAPGVEAAIDALDDDADVVLLDRLLPDRSGDEVLAEVASRGLDVRVAMLTAVRPDFDVIELGFDDYVLKPVTRDDLRATVGRLLTRSRYADGVQELFALVETRAALVAEKAPEELATNGGFAELEARIESTRAELRDQLTDVDDADFRVLMGELSTDDGGPQHAPNGTAGG